jgi:hypothetical protein
MTQKKNLRDELDRIRRVSDTLCTGHARLRDRFARRGLALDIAILALSTWLVALAFIEPSLNLSLTPFGLDGRIWSGLLAVGTFFLSIIQIKTDWKGRSDAHKRTLDIYAEVKREAGYLLAVDELEEAACRRVLARYDMEIPEREFLSLKRAHKVKVALSQHLETHPAASLTVALLRLWWRDNVGNREDK